VLGARDFNVR
jgi:hypothetical protein